MHAYEAIREQVRIKRLPGGKESNKRSGKARNRRDLERVFPANAGRWNGYDGPIEEAAM